MQRAVANTLLPAARPASYLHYPDKNALLQATTAARFRDLIARRGLSFTNCDGALRAIALGVCDYLAETTGCPNQLTRRPLEGSIIPVVEDMFKEGLAHHGTTSRVDHLFIFLNRQMLITHQLSCRRSSQCRRCYI